MSTRPEVSEERRTQIIQSATRVFARQGFANTRMDDVAVEAGLSKGLLYWYFINKEEIITAIADLVFSAEFRKMHNLTGGGQTARAGLNKFLDIFLQDLHGTLKIAPVIHEFYSLAFRNATVRQIMHEYLRRFVTNLEPIVQYDMDSGGFETGSARQVTIAIGSALEGTLLLWAYAPDMVNPEEQLQISMSLILKSLEPRK